jgi:heptosyltransferase-2
VLAALRGHFATAHIAYLLRGYVEDVIAGGGWHDELVRWPTGKGVARERATLRTALELRARRYDLAILLTNSFRSAFVSFVAGVARRVGYARDGRGWLLTDRLRPLRENGRFVPTPILPYYIRLAEHVGCIVADRRLRLAMTPEQEAAGQALKRHYGLDRGRPYAIVNAGASFGASKCWPVDRYAELCERLPKVFGLTPVLIGAPREAALLKRIATIAHADTVCCTDPPTTLGSLKVLVRDAALLVGNDTGPRHYGEAFNVPLVTLFGPTHQAWVATDYAAEIKLQIPVDCGPCQLPECPFDHRCMTQLSVDMVIDAIDRVLGGRRTTLPLNTLPILHAAGNGACQRS